MSIKLCAQTNLDFNFKNSCGQNKTIETKINIQFPNGEIENLISNSDSLVKLSKYNYFKDSGMYVLLVNFKSESTRDSVNYDFYLNGNESLVDVSVGFRFENKFIKDRGKWIKGNKIFQGNITVFKYYNSIVGIEIKKLDIESSNSYKGPFFQLVNNSKETIYGEFLPGYFWGRIAFKNPDSTWSKKLIGNIDLSFVTLPPLYPDSSRVATVGSFGLFDQIPNGLYKYELLYSLNRNILGLEKYIDNGDFVWWTNKSDFYKIEYIFRKE